MSSLFDGHGLKAYDILSALDNARVECDGFANLATCALTYAGIEHQVLFGMLDTGNGSLPHFCLKVDHAIFDYRARMWCGDSVPHGVVGAEHISLYNDFKVHEKRSVDKTLFFILYEDTIENFFSDLITKKSGKQNDV